MDNKKKEKDTKKVCSIEGRDFVVVDSNYGKCKKITIVQGVDVLEAPRNPITLESVMVVEYENGEKEEIDTIPKLALTLGQVLCYTEEGMPGFLCNKQVVAAIGRAIANLDPFLDGEIEVPSEEEASEIIKKLEIPYPLMSYSDAEKTRPDIEIEWMKKWRMSGKLCQTEGGEFVIELKGKNRCNRKVEKKGEEVALEAIFE